VLNGLGLPPPVSEAQPGLALYTQDNILVPAVEAVKLRADIRRDGMTLDELGAR